MSSAPRHRNRTRRPHESKYLLQNRVRSPRPAPVPTPASPLSYPFTFRLPIAFASTEAEHDADGQGRAVISNPSIMINEPTPATPPTVVAHCELLKVLDDLASMNIAAESVPTILASGLNPKELSLAQRGVLSSLIAASRQRLLVARAALERSIEQNVMALKELDESDAMLSCIVRGINVTENTLPMTPPLIQQVSQPPPQRRGGETYEKYGRRVFASASRRLPARRVGETEEAFARRAFA